MSSPATPHTPWCWRRSPCTTAATTPTLGVCSDGAWQLSRTWTPSQPPLTWHGAGSPLPPPSPTTTSPPTTPSRTTCSRTRQTPPHYYGPWPGSPFPSPHMTSPPSTLPSRRHRPPATSLALPSSPPPPSPPSLAQSSGCPPLPWNRSTASAPTRGPPSRLARNGSPKSRPSPDPRQPTGTSPWTTPSSPPAAPRAPGSPSYTRPPISLSHYSARHPTRFPRLPPGVRPRPPVPPPHHHRLPRPPPHGQALPRRVH